MQLLEAFALAFINTFGITQPSALQRRRAAWFIAGLLVLMMGLVALIGYSFFVAMRR